MCAVNQSNRCEYVSSLIVQVPVSPYKSSQPRQMSLENHFSKQQQWESVYIQGVEGHGCIRSWNPNVLEEAFLPNSHPMRCSTGGHALLTGRKWLWNELSWFFSRAEVSFSVLGLMSQQQPLCRPQQRERGKDEQVERERLRKPKRWMKTEGAKERDRWRKTQAGNGVLSALLGEFWAHFFLGPLLVLLRSQAAALWWKVNVKVLPGTISVPACSTCSYNCPQALQSCASHYQRR